MIELFLLFIFYQYYKVEEEHIQTNIFLEMKNYSLSFDDNRFDIDIVPRKKQALYELSMDAASLFILVPFQDFEDDLLKIIYPKTAYMQQLNSLEHTLMLQFSLLSFIAILLAIAAAFYTLKPIRTALVLLEDFIKDIIHDLHTPLTSILINLKMITQHTEEIESISCAAKNISMLHQNLDAYLKETQVQKETFSVKYLVEEQVKWFASLYDYLVWKVDIEEMMIITDKNAFTRILYNLLSNACKYNTAQGSISIEIKDSYLYIENESYGIENPSLVFHRFYKESERGLGIGLHIVAKLCDELKIQKHLALNENRVIFSLDLRHIIMKP